MYVISHFESLLSHIKPPVVPGGGLTVDTVNSLITHEPEHPVPQLIPLSQSTYIPTEDY